MCDICRQSICPPACPAYRGNLPNLAPVVGDCVLCGGAIREGETHLERENERLCAACAAEMEMSDLLYLAHSERLGDLLCELLGWQQNL